MLITTSIKIREKLASTRAIKKKRLQPTRPEKSKCDRHDRRKVKLDRRDRRKIGLTVTTKKTNREKN